MRILLYLIFCFLLSDYVAAQQVEKKSLLFSNTDTTELLQQLQDANQIVSCCPDSALAIYQSAIAASKTLLFNKGIAQGYLKSGDVFRDKGQYSKALKAFQQALPYCTGKDAYLNALVYNGIGNVYIYLSNFDAAVTALLKSVQYAQQYEHIAQTFPLQRIYANLSIPLINMKQFDRAHYYLDLSYQISQEKKDTSQQIKTLTNKAILFDLSGKDSLSIVYYDSVVVLARKFHNGSELFAPLANLANLYIKVNNIPKALPLLHQAKNIQQSYSIATYERAGLHLLLAKAYISNRNWDSAHYWLDIAGKNVQTLPYKQAELKKLYAEFYQEQQEYKKALESYRQFVDLKDEIDNNERAATIAELETIHRTTEKDRDLLESQLALSQKDQQLRINRLLLIGGGSILLLLILALLLYRRNIQNQQRRQQQAAEMEQLQAAMDSEQRERSRIAMELHDGIISNLTAIKLSLETVQPNEQYLSVYKNNLEQLGSAIVEIRDTAHNLMPEILINYHPEKAIEMLCQTIEKTRKLKVEFLAYGDFSEINTSTGHQLYRIVQELLQNIIKHAQATQVLVQLSSYNRRVAVAVEDNGIGIQNHHKLIRGMGFKSVQKRAAALNGNVTFGTSGFPSGLSVQIEFDIN